MPLECHRPSHSLCLSRPGRSRNCRPALGGTTARRSESVTRTSFMIMAAPLGPWARRRRHRGRRDLQAGSDTGTVPGPVEWPTRLL